MAIPAGDLEDYILHPGNRIHFTFGTAMMTTAERGITG